MFASISLALPESRLYMGFSVSFNFSPLSGRIIGGPTTTDGFYYIGNVNNFPLLRNLLLLIEEDRILAKPTIDEMENDGLCSSLNFQTARSAAVLLAAYKIPPVLFTPSFLFLFACSRATEANSTSVNTWPGSSLGLKMATTEEVITTEVSCEPAFRADSRSVSLPLRAGVTVFS